MDPGRWIRRKKATLYQYVSTAGARHGVSGAVRVWGSGASESPLTAHVSEGEKSCQEGIRLNALSDNLPIGKCLLCLVHQVENFSARETTSSIVIRFVAGLLKIDERACNTDELWLQCLAIQSRDEFRRQAITRKLLSDLFHGVMAKGPRQAVAECVPIATGKHALRRFIDQQMEESVVRGRNRPA